MSKEKEIVRFRVARFNSEIQPYTVTADNEQQEQAVRQDPRFMGWLGGWHEVEAPFTCRDEQGVWLEVKAGQAA